MNVKKLFENIFIDFVIASKSFRKNKCNASLEKPYIKRKFFYLYRDSNQETLLVALNITDMQNIKCIDLV